MSKNTATADEVIKKKIDISYIKKLSKYMKCHVRE